MAPTYRINYSTSNDWTNSGKPSLNVNEGSTINWGLYTSGLTTGATIYWKIEGTGINSTDYTYESLSGQAQKATLYRSSGTIGFDTSTSFKINQDLKTEGPEFFTIKAYSDPGRTSLVASSPQIQISDTSTTPAQGHKVTASSTQINEGEKVTVTIDAPGKGYSDYAWYAYGTNWDRSDFSSIKVNGIEEVNSIQFNSTGFSGKSKLNAKRELVNGSLDAQGRATIELILANDTRRDGSKSMLFGASFLGVGNERPNVSVFDSSTGPLYSISTPSTTVKEGTSAVFTVDTREVANNTQVNWLIEGPRIPWYLKDTINSGDISDGILTGQGTINNGRFTKPISIKADNVTEGDEQLVFRLFTKDWTKELATKTITIIDTSRAASHKLLTSKVSINEGEVVTSSVETQNVNQGTILHWSVSGTNVDSADLSAGALTGQGTVGSDGKFSFTHTLANDLKTEGDETLQLKVFSDAARTQQVGTTASVLVKDTSTSPIAKNLVSITKSSTIESFSNDLAIGVPNSNLYSADLKEIGWTRTTPSGWSLGDYGSRVFKSGTSEYGWGRRYWGDSESQASISNGKLNLNLSVLGGQSGVSASPSWNMLYDTSQSTPYGDVKVYSQAPTIKADSFSFDYSFASYANDKSMGYISPNNNISFPTAMVYWDTKSGKQSQTIFGSGTFSKPLDFDVPTRVWIEVQGQIGKYSYDLTKALLSIDNFTATTNVVKSTASSDILTGSSERETFTFESAPNYGGLADVVTGFNQAQGDIIALKKSAFGIATNTEKASIISVTTNSELLAALGSANMFVYDQSNGNLWWNQDGAQQPGAGSGGIFATFSDKALISSSAISLY